ncbi:MAG: hypothetical protein M0C28_44315 [Candidatus Moduliflexus flocculans]|nr:hypothetical protein [Candidatus Moduliflexus flocculans]
MPSVEGRGEWINTSTYIFHPETAMLGGTEYTVSMSEDLKTGSGVGLDAKRGQCVEVRHVAPASSR